MKIEKIKNAPYPLPKGWEWVRLGEIFNIKRGGSPRPISKYLIADENGINWIKISDVQDSSKYIIKTKEKIKSEGIKKSRLIKPYDLLLSNSMSYGKAFISKIEGCIHDGWLLLRPINYNILIEYFYYLLNSQIIALQFKKSVQGGIVKNLNIEIVKNIIAPLPFKNSKPDLEKQKQIVEKIETIFKEIDKAITLRQKALEDTKKLFESSLNKIFKEAKEDKENWKWVKLGEIFDIKRGGSPRPISKYLTTDKNGINWIKISDAQDSSKYITKTKEKIRLEGIQKSRLIRPYDLLLSNSMSYGKAFISTIEGCIHDGWLLLRPISYDIFIEFFYYLLNSQIIGLQFRKNVQGGIVKNLNIDIVKNTIAPIPIKNNQPDLKKQKEIAKYLDNLYNKIKKLEDLQQIQIEKFKQLKESILNKVFIGELV